MNLKEQIYELLNSLYNIMRRRKSVILALSCVVVFITTYMLILPAFTLEKDEAAKQGGIDVPKEASFEITDEEVNIEAYSDAHESTDDEIGAEADSDAHESTDDEFGVEDGSNELESSDDVQQNNSRNDDKNANAFGDDKDPLKYEGEDYSITVSDKEEVLPEGTSIVVEEIDKKDKAEDYDTYYKEALSAINDEEGKNKLNELKFARFYDISLVADDETIEPEEGDSVNVRIEYDKELRKELGVENTENVKILHFTEDEETGQLTTEILDSKENNVTIDTDRKDRLRSAEFDAESFSVYAVVYTVDFHYEFNGKSYDYSIPGGGFISLAQLVNSLELSEDTGEFIEEIENVEFSDPELIWVGKAEKDTTVGALKEQNGLDIQYSDDLTKDEINEINSQSVEKGDWALISLKPFTSEESLTVTMKNGDQFEIKVTDDRVTNTEDIDDDKEYILYTLINGKYYVLKTDGSTVVTENFPDLDTMGQEYKWNIKYVYVDGSGQEYYMIKPCNDNTRSIDLSWDSTFSWETPNDHPLVKQDNCNVTLTPSGNGFKIEGYNNSKLVIEDGWFAGRMGDSYNDIVIYEQGHLSQYEFNVNSEDYAMGKVCGTDKSGEYKEDSEYDAVTNNEKYNQYEIKAQPQTARYMFDYWDLNGERLALGATIPAGTLQIPYQGSRLTAHFKKDPNYQTPDDEKEGRVIDKESFQAWLNELRNRNIPLNQDNCTKTAELYDYENRIYRVDLTAQSNLSMFDGDIDLGFIIDVSGSMQFPSKLIPVSGKESVDVLNLNANWNTQHQLDTSKEYYIIVDRTNTANVLRLKWNNGTNPAYPNHTGWPTGNPNSSSTRWITGWGICGLGYEKDALDGATRYLSTENATFIDALFNGDSGPFQIYEAGDNGKQRKEYLESSIAGTISELNSILGDLAYANNASEAADVKVAYNTFADAVDYNHTNHNFVSVTSGLSIGYDYNGGTDTEEALIDANSFFWNDSATKVAVLITDGAPQQSGVDGPTLDARVKAAADTLKAQGIKLVTVGLSMGDVKRGSRLLYDIATKDSDGDPYFYKAETGDELQYALYEVIQQVMADAIVVGNVTDTVNEAFYPVDKNTGEPLKAGNVIDLEGNKIANNERGLTDEQKAAGYGVIGIDNNDNYTVTWSGQNFTWEGWHGTVYEKAKEDFLGGNAVRTNDPDSPARIESEGYKIHPEDNTIAFKQEIKDQGKKTLETPRVNVNELDLTDCNTEWTVYLGTEVDPKSQLEAFYDNILVKEVVTAATDQDNDGLPDRMTDTNMYYPLLESISDGRESSATGEQVTFKLKDLLKKLNNGTDITIDDLIAAGSDGITLPYDLYGQDCPGTINIKLTKSGGTADYDPHETTVTGDAIETYDLSVIYAPDYEHVPTGQGGDGSKPYHTGTYSLAYQGHAAGEDYSTNTHIINVYNVPLDVYKTDDSDQPLQGATFKLYKAGGSGTISGLSGNYTEVASGTSGANGVARLTFTDGMGTGLVPGETYFLVEDEAPEGYTKDNTVWTVQVQPEIGKFTDLEGVQIHAPDYPNLGKSMYPFNWDQGARIVVDGQPVKVIAKGETVNTTTTITDGSYVSHKNAISFRHTVRNLKNELNIKVNKNWEDYDDPDRPASVTVKLYRVSEKGHQWAEGAIVPCSCTVDGVKEYTCSVCNAKDTHVITASGHEEGSPHRENYQAPTCTEAGGYDTVVRCKVCNAIISSKHMDIPATGHTWENKEIATSDSDRYCYDTADVCSKCETVNEETRVHHDHDWSDWEGTAAAINIAGQERRVCSHDTSHIESRTLPPLPATVNIYFRCTGDGSGNQSWRPTFIAERHATGVGDMTIQWDWNRDTGDVQSIAVEGLSGDASYNTYTTPNGAEYNVQNGVERGKRQTLTISNITTNQTIYITIRNWNWAGTNEGLIYQPTFDGNYSNPTLNTSSRSFSLKSLLKGILPPLRGTGEKSENSIPSVLNGISGLKSKEEALCGEKYWEEVPGTYTITGTDNWSLSIIDLLKYNEYGKEYQYYVEEVSPSSGYEVTYTGQGAQNEGDAVAVTNEKSEGSLQITKNVHFNGRTAATDEEKALVNGAYTFTVKNEDGVEIMGSPFTVNVDNGVSNSILIQNLAAGDYTIEETNSGNLVLDSAAGGKSVNNNIATATVTAGKRTETDLLDTAKAEFTNNYISYEVIIVKVDTGNTETKLGGAKFDLYSEDAVEDGGIKDGAVPLMHDLISSSDTEDRGKVSLGMLPAGTYYLFETEAPLGYEKLDEPVTITVSDNRVSLMQGTRIETSEISQDKTELYVMNTVGVTLPHTGGIGTTIFYVLGTMLVLCCGLYLTARRRIKKNKDMI